ncbi:MAG: hypothetical protein ACTTKL_01025 [Treponema sp.]
MRKNVKLSKRFNPSAEGGKAAQKEASVFVDCRERALGVKVIRLAYNLPPEFSGREAETFCLNAL